MIHSCSINQRSSNCISNVAWKKTKTANRALGSILKRDATTWRIQGSHVGHEVKSVDGQKYEPGTSYTWSERRDVRIIAILLALTHSPDWSDTLQASTKPSHCTYIFSLNLLTCPSTWNYRTLAMKAVRCSRSVAGRSPSDAVSDHRRKELLSVLL